MKEQIKLTKAELKNLPSDVDYYECMGLSYAEAIVEAINTIINNRAVPMSRIIYERDKNHKSNDYCALTNIDNTMHEESQVQNR